MTLFLTRIRLSSRLFSTDLTASLRTIKASCAFCCSCSSSLSVAWKSVADVWRVDRVLNRVSICGICGRAGPRRDKIGKRPSGIGVMRELDWDEWRRCCCWAADALSRSDRRSLRRRDKESMCRGCVRSASWELSRVIKGNRGGGRGEV